MVLGAHALRTDKLSLAPDPYVVMYRTLPDGSTTPFYRSEHLLTTREATWRTEPIPMQRLCNGDLQRTILIEVRPPLISP